VDRVKETCVDPSGGNRDAAPPKCDTADKCSENNRKCVLHCFIQRMGIVTTTIEKYQFVILYYLFLATIKWWAPDMIFLTGSVTTICSTIKST
jgi:hypothetical protein